MINTVYREKNFVNTTCNRDTDFENKLCMISSLQSSEDDSILSAGRSSNIGRPNTYKTFEKTALIDSIQGNLPE